MAQVNQEVVQEMGRRCADQLDRHHRVDATIIESWKQQAQPTYQGGQGYQPVVARWAEMDLVVADEFRDGNVPAHAALLPVTKRAFQALPETVKELYFRGDSSCWERELLNWLRDEQRSEGPRGSIPFAVSVRMSSGLKKHILLLPDSVWTPYRSDRQTESECADVLNYWPEEEEQGEGAGPLRYTAIRVR